MMRSEFFDWDWLHKQIVDYINDALKKFTSKRVEEITVSYSGDFFIKFSNRKNAVKFFAPFVFRKATLEEFSTMIESLSNTCIRMCMKKGDEEE